MKNDKGYLFAICLLTVLIAAFIKSCVYATPVKAASPEEMQNIYGDYIPIKATAYCSCQKCCGKDDGITASGRKAIEGLTVASNTYYGKGIYLYDENMDLVGIYECMDKGTDGIDVYIDSHQRAREFGIRYYYIQVIDAVG